jgi:hypothetical protein
VKFMWCHLHMKNTNTYITNAEMRHACLHCRAEEAKQGILARSAPGACMVDELNVCPPPCNQLSSRVHTPSTA